MFPEDFFSSPNQYKTIQNPISKNREHPKIINPTLLNKKINQPFIPEIKEEKCEESVDNPNNKNNLKIIIPQNVSNEEISTSGGSYNTPKTPNIPIRPIIQSEPKNKKNVRNIKDKLIQNNGLNKNCQNNNCIKDENIDLYYPMAFTFNSKGKKSNTLNNSRHKNYKYHKSFENNKKNLENKDKNINNRKRKNLSFQKSEEKNKNENDKNTKNKNLIHSNNKNIIFDKNKYWSENNKNNAKNILRNNIKGEDRKNSRNNYVPSNNRKVKSAKKSKENVNIITLNNNKNMLRRINNDDKKDILNRGNIKNFKSEYDKKKKEIVNLKIKNKINHILANLPENYEKFPVLNNKFELLMKNIDDIKDVLDRKNMFARNKVNKK